MPSQYDPHKHHRRSIRLKGYDYTRPGSYFVTICTHNREHLFGNIVNERMELNPLGQRVHQYWGEIPNHFPHATLDEYVVMPNHVHGIIVMEVNVGANNYSPRRQPRGTSKTIGSIIRGFKIGVTQWTRQNTDIHTVWQRNYYEHIIRNEAALQRIRQYIINNPLKWKKEA